MRALVTGGTAGIGLAIAEGLRGRGVEVFAPSRRNGYDFLTTDAIARCKADCGPVDVLVNNVGGGGRWGPAEAETAPDSVWAEVYQKNAAVAASLTAWALPGMMANGWGRVVTISSIHGLEAGGRPWFVAAKAAQIAMMKAFSRDPRFVRCGITFNTVCPGHIAVPGKPVFAPDSPLGRMGTPAEVAAVVLFLCTSEAAFVNGAAIAVDGGESRSF